MGPLFNFAFAVIVALFAGVMSAIVFRHVLVPFYYWVKKIPENQRKITGDRLERIAKTVGVIISITIIAFIIFGFVRMFQLESDYWKSKGFDEFYRMPLEYPYEMLLVSGDNLSELCEWPNEPTLGHKSIIMNIAKYHKEGKFVVGEIQPDSVRNSLSGNHAVIWFIFNCSTGRYKFIQNKDEYLNELLAQGIKTEPQLKTFKEFYWGESED